MKRCFEVIDLNRLPRMNDISHVLNTFMERPTEKV